MAFVGDNYTVGWLRYNRKESGKQQALCGVVTTEGYGDTLTIAGGFVGCKRCCGILEKRGVLPLAIKQVSDRHGNFVYVAIE